MWPAYGHRRLRDILHPEDGSEQPEGHFTVGPDAQVSGKYTLIVSGAKPATRVKKFWPLKPVIFNTDISDGVNHEL